MSAIISPCCNYENGQARTEWRLNENESHPTFNLLSQFGNYSKCRHMVTCTCMAKLQEKSFLHCSSRKYRSFFRKGREMGRLKWWLKLMMFNLMQLKVSSVNFTAVRNLHQQLLHSLQLVQPINLHQSIVWPSEKSNLKEEVSTVFNWNYRFRKEIKVTFSSVSYCPVAFIIVDDPKSWLRWNQDSSTPQFFIQLRGIF